MTTFNEDSDFPNGIHQTIILQDGDTFTGTSNAAADYDWIPVQLSANKSYVVKFNSSFGSPRVDVIDSTGVDKSSNESSVSGDTMVWVTPTTTGLHYIRVNGSLFTSGPDIGPYTVTVESEVVNNANTTESISLDYTKEIVGSYTGVHDYVQDQDWIEIDADAGYNYLVSILDGVTNTAMRIFDANGNQVAFGNDSSNNPIGTVSFTPQASGKYYITTDLSINRLRPSDLNGENYQITVRTEAPANANTKFTIGLGETIDGSNNFYNDYDWYKVELNAGVSYLADNIAGSLSQIAFVKANGDLVDSTSRDYNTKLYDVITPQTSGTYYVYVNPYDGDYKVSLSSEVSGDITSVSTVNVGQTLTSSVDFYKDKDVFGVDVVAGEKYTVTANLDVNSSRKIKLEILDSSGNVTTTTSFSDKATSEFTAQSSGKIYLAVSDSGVATVAANYDLSIVLKDLEILGTAAADLLDGTSENDVFKAEGGDDIITGGGGNDVIDGGTGTDTVIFGGNRADYSIVKGADGITTVIDGTGARDGIDTITNVEILKFADQSVQLNDTPTFEALFAANNSQTKGISALYETLLGGVPNRAGFIFLINTNNTTNFGAGDGPVFNDENIYINIANSLIQGNPAATAAFNAMATGATLVDQISSIYKAIIPADKQSAEGLDYLTSEANLAFYTAVASERGIASDNGPAIISFASLLKIAVDGNIGIGNAVNDLLAAVGNETSALPITSTAVVPIETADGTASDGDDTANNARSSFARAAEVEEVVYGSVDTASDNQFLDVIGVSGEAFWFG